VQGFDEYMNLVLDDAEEISMKKKTVKPLGTQSEFAAALTRGRRASYYAGRILLKGDNITMMMNTYARLLSVLLTAVPS
jgi:small nuclear ribonucleoprotein E